MTEIVQSMYDYIVFSGLTNDELKELIENLEKRLSEEVK